MARADELAACTERPGEITRRYGTPALVAARDLLEAWMLEAGMRTRVDRAGNLIGTLGAGDRPAILIGSHFDTVVDAGRYDGNLGILLGIGCAEELVGADAAQDLTVVAFCDEEGARFPTAYFGSRAFLGEPLGDGAMTDADGATLASGIEIAGNAAAEPGTGLPAGTAAYLEAHIEQGPVLEAAGHPLGIVTAITGGAKLAVTVTGTAGHAGTVPMELRRDAFSAAAEIALAAERLVRDDGEAVATVGQVAVSPGAANVIPGRAAISIDLRHPDDDRRGRLLDRVREIVAEVAARRGVEAAIEVVHDERSVVCDPALGERMRRAARAIGLDPPSLPSGAGHDAAVLSEHVPVAMLFVRCAGGISHNPAESVTEDDVAAALAVLTAVVRSAE
jgi:hydantoinase/carbamoylase family amidase